jgi:hypothetical protein
LTRESPGAKPAPGRVVSDGVRSSAASGAEDHGTTATSAARFGARRRWRIDKRSIWSLSIVGAVWIFAIMALVCADIFMRNVFNAPISGVAEFIALSVPALRVPSASVGDRGRRLVRAEVMIGAMERNQPRVAAALEPRIRSGRAFRLLEDAGLGLAGLRKNPRHRRVLGRPGRLSDSECGRSNSH